MSSKVPTRQPARTHPSSSYKKSRYEILITRGLPNALNRGHHQGAIPLANHKAHHRRKSTIVRRDRRGHGRVQHVAPSAHGHHRLGRLRVVVQTGQDGHERRHLSRTDDVVLVEIAQAALGPLCHRRRGQAGRAGRYGELGNGIAAHCFDSYSVEAQQLDLHGRVKL